MTEQRDIYRLYGSGNLEDQMNFILSRISDRLDRMEGLRGTPTFYKTVITMVGGGLTAGQVMRATSSEQVEMETMDVSDVQNAVPSLDSGEPAQIDLQMSLISLIDAENDEVVHQFPTQFLEYNCEVFQFSTNESFEVLTQNGVVHETEEDAVDGIIEGDGAGNYSAATNLPGTLLVDVRDENEEIVHQYPLDQSGQSSEWFGFH